MSMQELQPMLHANALMTGWLSDYICIQGCFQCKQQQQQQQQQEAGSSPAACCESPSTLSRVSQQKQRLAAQ